MAKTSIKEVMMGKAQFRVSSRLADVLSARLYATAPVALNEVVANGRDACVRRGAPIVIHIRTFEPGSQWFEGHTMVVTDYGCGFPTEKHWNEYLHVAESYSERRHDLYGANGVGKLAPLFFAKSYTVRSCPNSGMDVTTVHIRNDQVFPDANTSDIHFFLGRRGDLPTDPESGPFTSIIIENIEKPYAPDQIMEDLTKTLAIEERTITVNGVLVPSRKTIGDAISLSTERAMPKIGVVSCEIGVVERSTRADTIKLLGGGREICTLDDIPLSFRRQLAPIFFHPHLYGWINVANWTKKSTIGKQDLREDALSKGEWGAFIRSLELYFRKPLEAAVELLDLGVPSPDRMISTLRTLTATFENRYPVDPEMAAQFGFGAGIDSAEDDVPGTRGPNKGRHPGSVEGTGKGTPKGRTRKPGVGSGTRTTTEPTFLIRIEKTLYRLYPVNSAEAWPAYVKRGNIIILAVTHPRYEQVRKRGVKAELTFLEQIVVEAHVRQMRPGDGPGSFSSEVYQILSNL